MRQANCAIVLMMLSTTMAVVTAQSTKLDFEKDEIGKPPTGFSFAVTGQGQPGVWIVKRDDQAHGNVLDAKDGTFKDAGKVGLWTKADSVMAFDDFSMIARVQEPLTLAGSIDLPGVEGRIDHLAFDAASQRLFVAALGHNTVEVADVR